MTSLFSAEELIQYLYHETTPEKTAAIEEALLKNVALREKLDTLKASAERLDQIIESPRTETVLNVLRYARETAPATPHD
ncbi:MAG: hypothetical protein RL732_1064 [Bacteroidota bacterium]|jgi:anti-sigma factor RsiW